MMVSAETKYRKRQARRKHLDAIASKAVRLGGIIILTAIIAILVFIVKEVAPLWTQPQLAPLKQTASSSTYIKEPNLVLQLLAKIDVVAVTNEKPICAAISPDGLTLLVGTEKGGIFYWRINGADAVLNGRMEIPSKEDKDADQTVTAICFILGGKSFIAGQADGRLSVWYPVITPGSPSGQGYRIVRTFPATGSAIKIISNSPRDRGFIAVDIDGKARLLHTTSGRTLAHWYVGPNTETLTYTPKADGVIAVNAQGNQQLWQLINPHPDMSWQTLFGKVWYEGYQQPEYVWQSTGGTDEYEAKLSLIPIIAGTIKGAFYTILLALPIAILAAIYTSQFMTPRLRAVTKPIIEMMAAMPSVVLGFLAGMWLAPLVVKNVLAVFLALLTMPLCSVAAYKLWRRVPINIRQKIPVWIETLLSYPVVIGSMVMAILLSAWLQKTFFAGDFPFWLFQRFGSQYELRNAMIAGIAMSFAVIPIIYTISEDAISAVPQSLMAGSLALGATRWQTVWHVMVPVALPGIFAASMVGFGRAVGETMIVLMATGNTPILSWLPFNGFRTMSANIAVEMPEAPVGGTLYRVLFLTALLLFILTFIVNTAAELVRLRMRRRVSQL